MSGRDSIQHGLRWQVKSGCTIDVWKDPWVPLLPRFRINSAKPPYCSVNVVSDLINWQDSKWNFPVLRSLFNEEEVKAISCISVRGATQNNQDSICWHFDSKGIYSVKSAYRHLKNTSSSAVPSTGEQSTSRNIKWWNLVWSLNIPPKLKIFLWRCFRNAIPTGDNLFKRGGKVNPLCQRRNESVETLEHLIFICEHSRMI